MSVISTHLKFHKDRIMDDVTCRSVAWYARVRHRRGASPIPMVGQMFADRANVSSVFRCYGTLVLVFDTHDIGCLSEGLALCK